MADPIGSTAGRPGDGVRHSRRGGGGSACHSAAHAADGSDRAVAVAVPAPASADRVGSSAAYRGDSGDGRFRWAARRFAEALCRESLRRAVGRRCVASLYGDAGVVRRGYCARLCARWRRRLRVDLHAAAGPVAESVGAPGSRRAADEHRDHHCRQRRAMRASRRAVRAAAHWLRSLRRRRVFVSAGPKWSADPALLRNPIHLLAFGFGSGLAPRAPGTFGTLVAVPIVLGVMQFGFAVHLAFAIVAAVAGIWLCGESARRLGVHDHPGIVWDEITGYTVTMLATPPDWYWLAGGFVLFRFFDIVKPWPIREADHSLSGGLGIMLDDIIAGIFAAAILFAVKLFIP